MADSDPGPSSDKPEDAVLGEVLVNQSALQRSTTIAQPLEVIQTTCSAHPSRQLALL
jgi:hypothetical protein